MQNKGIKKTIKTWSLGDVEEGSDVFGECLIEEFGEEVPEGMFNDNMHEALVDLMKKYKGGVIDLDKAADKAVEAITDPENYDE